MDAAQALADLAEISSQIDVAVLLTADGVVLGATIDDEARAARLGEGALRLLQEAPSGPDGSAPAQLEATTPHGGVFVVLSLAWGWALGGIAPDRWDVAGAALCLAGVAVIMYAPR